MKAEDYYLQDFLNQLLDRAFELRSSAVSEFDRGVLQGYYEVISHALNLAESFGISSSLPENLREFEVEQLLDRNPGSEL